MERAAEERAALNERLEGDARVSVNSLVLKATALALKYPNVFLDTSALYFDNPLDFLRYAMTQQVPLTVFERSLRHQLVFGSDNPRIEIKSMAKAVRSLGFSEECLELIFRINAEKLLEPKQ